MDAEQSADYGTLDGTNAEQLLSRFEQFSGVIVCSVVVSYTTHLIAVRVEAFDTHRPPGDVSPWTCVELEVADGIECSINESERTPGVQVDDSIEIVWLDSRCYIVFDPLQARDFSKVDWSIEQVRASKFYIAGQRASWRIIPDAPRYATSARRDGARRYGP